MTSCEPWATALMCTVLACTCQLSLRMRSPNSCAQDTALTHPAEVYIRKQKKLIVACIAQMHAACFLLGTGHSSRRRLEMSCDSLLEAGTHCKMHL